jgi:hypothetical protein
MSAVLTDSVCSTNSYVSPWIQTNIAEFWIEINTRNSGANPTDFMSIGILYLEIKLKQC